MSRCSTATCFLAGDAAHTVPPTGAKGMNLAIADVYALAKAMDGFFTSSERKMLDGYTETVFAACVGGRSTSRGGCRRCSIAYQTTAVFGHRRQLAELDMVTRSVAGRTLIAENYVGTPLHQ